MVRPEQERVKKLLTEAVSLLCRNSLQFEEEVEVEGLLGITLDKRDIFLVSIRETIQNTLRQVAKKRPNDNNESHDSRAESPNAAKRRRQRERRKREEEAANHSETEEESRDATEAATPASADPSVPKIKQEREMERTADNSGWSGDGRQGNPAHDPATLANIKTDPGGGDNGGGGTTELQQHQQTPDKSSFGESSSFMQGSSSFMQGSSAASTGIHSTPQQQGSSSSAQPPGGGGGAGNNSTGINVKQEQEEEEDECFVIDDDSDGVGGDDDSSFLSESQLLAAQGWGGGAGSGDGSNQGFDMDMLTAAQQYQALTQFGAMPGTSGGSGSASFMGDMSPGGTSMAGMAGGDASQRRMGCFVCHLCKRQYKRKAALCDHMRAIHQNIKKYMCSLCNRGYFHRGDFKRHLNKHL